MVTDPPYGVEYDPLWRNEAGAAKTKRTGKVLNDDRADWREAWALFPGDVAYVWHGALHAATVAESLMAAVHRRQCRAVRHWRNVCRVEGPEVGRMNGRCAGQSVNSLQLREWLLSASYYTTVHDLIEI
jgi:hypothetical protein